MSFVKCSLGDADLAVVKLVVKEVNRHYHSVPVFVQNGEIFWKPMQSGRLVAALSNKGLLDLVTKIDRVCNADLYEESVETS